MLSTLLKTTILAEDVSVVYLHAISGRICYQLANLCVGEGGGAFMQFVTEIVIYSHFMGQMTINQSFLWKLSSLEL